MDAGWTGTSAFGSMAQVGWIVTITIHAFILLLVLWIIVSRVMRRSTERRRRSMVAVWRPLLAESLASAGEREVLVEGLPRAWRFAYLELRSDGELDWQTRWQQQPGLPVLLRLTPPRRQRDAAELLVAPRDMAYAIFNGR